MKTKNNIRWGVFILDILLLTVFTIGFYYLIAYIAPTFTQDIQSLPWLLFIYISCYSISFFYYPSIVQFRMMPYETITKRVLTTCLTMLFLVALFLIAANPTPRFPRTFLFSSIAIFTFCLWIERLVLKKTLNHLRKNRKNTSKVVLVGNGDAIQTLFDTFYTPDYGYEIVAIFSDIPYAEADMEAKRIGGIGTISKWLSEQNDIDEMYCCLPKDRQDVTDLISRYCDNHFVSFNILPFATRFNHKMDVTFIKNIPVVSRTLEPLKKITNRIVKRTFDLIFSILVLVLLFPWVFIGVAIIIKRQSPGPIFFLQERTGLDGKIFKCIKFRSMAVNDAADTVQATENDPRKFPFGNLMRKYNIDELPQFINVFKGEMSIVGPRPHMLKHTKEYSKIIDNFMVRHHAKPGITGLAQVTGFRGETRLVKQMEGRVKKDIEYIENWSFLLDMKIIVKTVINMFGKEKGNAY